EFFVMVPDNIFPHPRHICEHFPERFINNALGNPFLNGLEHKNQRRLWRKDRPKLIRLFETAHKIKLVSLCDLRDESFSGRRSPPVKSFKDFMLACEYIRVDYF